MRKTKGKETEISGWDRRKGMGRESETFMTGGGIDNLIIKIDKVKC